jgi:hypothetical protein
MANQKITDFTVATSIGSSDVIPIVQSNTNKQITFNALTTSATITATNSNTGRSLADRFADRVNVKDFGADSTGTNASDSAFISAIAAAGTNGIIYVPKGTYKVNTDVQAASSSSFFIDPSVTFTGTGWLHRQWLGQSSGFNIDPNTTSILFQKGTPSNPAVAGSATIAATKYCNSSEYNGDPDHSIVGFSDPTIYGGAVKNSTYANARAQGIFGEALDAVGGDGTFVEGGRFHGINATNGLGGAAQGVVAYAQAGLSASPTNIIASNSKFVIGVESEISHYNAHAPVPRLFNPTAGIKTSFLATNRYGNAGDAAFLLNPYNVVPFQAGFVVPASAALAGQPSPYGPVSATGAAFACYQNTPITYGIDLAKGKYSFAAISIPNNTPIRAYNYTGSSEDNILYYGTDTWLYLGTNASGVKTTSILPQTDNSYTLGTNTPTNVRWSNIYTVNAVTVGSDERVKTDITPTDLGLEFINSLNPVKYKLKVGNNNVVGFEEDGTTPIVEPIPGKRTHYGLIAQEVKAALPEGTDFGGWVLSDKNDPNSEQALRYEEFISPLIKAIQEQQVQINTLQAELSTLKLALTAI